MDDSLPPSGGALPDITYHFRRGQPRGVRQLAAVYRGYLQMVEADPKLRVSQVAAKWLLQRALAQEDGGAWEVEYSPDEADRSRKAPDYVLMEPVSGRRMAVEASQIRGFQEQMQQRSIYLRLFGELGLRLEGKLQGAFELLCPMLPPPDSSDLEVLVGDLSAGILAADREIAPGESRVLAGCFVAVKQSNLGEQVALSVLMLRKGMSRTGPPLRPTTEMLSEQLAGILDESREKFRSVATPETAVVLQVHLDAPPGTDLAAAVRSLQADRTGITRLYVFDSPFGYFGRVW